MTDIETKIKAEDFTEELTDEALDREERAGGEKFPFTSFSGR